MKTGATSDTTPPPPPHGVRVSATPDATVEITWDADADFESGLQSFVIQRDGQDIGQVPEKPVGKFGRPLFQGMSYHDTPEKPLPEMRFVDRSTNAGLKERVPGDRGQQRGPALRTCQSSRISVNRRCNLRIFSLSFSIRNLISSHAESFQRIAIELDAQARFVRQADRAVDDRQLFEHQFAAQRRFGKLGRQEFDERADRRRGRQVRAGRDADGALPAVRHDQPLALFGDPADFARLR